MKPTTPFSLNRITLCLLLAGVLSACGNKDPEQLVTAARGHLQKNDNAAAIIELKNALQEKPDLVDARLLLGKALLASGDPVGAEAELRKLREANHAPNEVAPLLAKAWLAQGQAKKVTDAFDDVRLGSAQAQAELLTSVAVAWRMQDRKESHLKRLEEALALSPDLGPAVIERVRLQAADRAFDKALAELDALLTREPKNGDALKLRGDLLLFGLQKQEDAAQAYRAAIVAEPKQLDAHVALVRLLMAKGSMEESGKALEALVSIAPSYPGTLYLQAQRAYRQKDMKVAKERAQQLLKRSSDSPVANELAGVIELQAGSVVQAQAYLNKALKAAPGLREARRALVLAYLMAGQLDQAIAALPADLKGPTGDADPALLSIAGRAYMAKGEFEIAQEYFQRATKSDPKDPSKRTSLAVSQFMSGQTELALNELSEIASQDQGVVADMALINAHMKRKDFVKALAAIESLEKKKAQDPMPRHLKGLAFLMQNNRVKARAAFEEALGLDSRYLAAVAGLASLDISDKQPQAAVQRMDALTKQSPENPQAWLALADLLEVTGAGKEKVGAAIEQAVKVAPAESRARVRLVDFYLRQKDDKSALAAAQAGVAALPDSPEVVAGLGRAQSAAGESHQAQATFNKLVSLMPGSPMPHLLMASAQLKNKENSAAMQSLEKALGIQPDFMPAQRAMLEVAVAEGMKEKALSISKDVQKQRPTESVGYMLEGDIRAAFKEWDAAATAYRVWMKSAQVPEAAVRLHSMLVLGGKQAEADRLSADWMKNHPKDVGFPLYLGDRALKGGDLGKASQYYEKVIAVQQDNAFALNNLAWVAGQLGRPDALSLAERANAAAPNTPVFMDTLAMLLSSKGDHDRALAMQTKVVEQKPDVPDFKLNLARIQIKAGKGDLARKTLDELAALGSKYPAQAEVAKLSKGL